MKKVLITLSLAFTSIIVSNAQCCNVVSTNGVNAIATNGKCVVTASGLSGDCGNTVVNTPILPPVDSDGDGVSDNEDNCPKVYGTINGCPDSDYDGIADNKDKCPSIAGLDKFDGCPDTDGDGIVDSQDACPSVAGLSKFNGCADTDQDGIADPNDACPTVFGTLNGCPDKDNDNVADKEDVCPETPGLVENKGCPAVEAKELAILEKAINGVKFESGKDIITKSSLPILDNVVKVLKNKPMYNLAIEGHTDAQGDDTKNLDLSKKRATAVKKYLTDKGIAPTRLSSEGFGEAKPVATNDTPAGRAENRRVELIVKF